MQSEIRNLAERLLRDGNVTAAELRTIDLDELVRALHTEHHERIAQITELKHASTGSIGAPNPLGERSEGVAQTSTWITSIIDTLPAHIALLDSTGKILAVNKAWKRFAQANVFQGTDFGVGANYIEVCLTSHGECVDQAHAVARGIQNVLDGSLSEFKFDYPCHSPDVFRWFRLLVTPLHLGNPEKVVVMHFDITGQQLSEQILRDSEARYRAVVQTALDCILVIGAEGRILEFNPAAEQTFGYSREEALEQFLVDLIVVPELRGTWEQNLRQAIDSSDAPILGQRQETPALRKDGGVIAVELSITRNPWEPVTLTCILRDISERKRVQEALRASEARLRTILDNEPECVKIVSRSGHLVEMNQSGLQLIEANRLEAVVGKHVGGLIHPEDLPAYLGLHQRCCQGESGRLQFRILGLRGTIRWMESTSTPLRDPAGAIESVLSVTRDITEQFKAERALLEAERRFRLLLTSVGEGIQGIDLEGRITFQNPALLTMFGYTENELLGKIAHEHLHHHHSDGSEYPLEECPLYQTLRDGVTRRVKDEVFFRKDGSTVPVEYTCSAVRDEFGLIVGSVQVLADVSERKRAETALRASEEQYRTLLDRIPDPMFVYDRDTLAYLAVNDAAIASYGYTREEFLAMTIKDIRPPEDVPALLEMLASVPGGYQNRGVWRHRTKDGTTLIVEITAHDITLAGRKACIILARDITERKRAEETIRTGEERLRLALSAAQMGSYDWDIPNESVVWSDTHYEIFGYPPDRRCSVEYRHFADRVHPDDRSRVEGAIQQAMANRSDYSCEFRILLPDGSIRWVQGKGVFYYNDLGRPIRMLGTAADITSQKQMEESLRESEAQFRGVFEAAATGIAITKPDGTFVQCNAAYCQMVGYTEEELKRIDFTVLTHPEDLPRNLELINDLIEGTISSFVVEKRYLHRRGRTVWTRVGVSLVRDRENRPANIIGVAEDITPQKRAEEELRRSQQELKMASQISHMGAWHVDLPEMTLTWSDEIYAIFEFPGPTPPKIEEAIDFYLPEYRDTIRQAVEACINEGTRFDLELQIITAMGKPRWVRSIGEAARGMDGRILRIQGACQDISESKLAQKREQVLANRLADTLESISDAFFTLDREWRFTFLNLHAEKLLNRPRVSLLGKNVWSEFPDALGTRFEHEYRRALQNQVPVEFEEYYALLGIWFGVRAYPTVEGLAVYFHDVTVEKLAKEAIRESEERFRLVSRATNDAIWDWNLVTNDLRWNEGFEILFGYCREDIDRSIDSWTSCIHPDDSEAILSSIFAAIEGRARQWSGEYRFRCKNGNYAFVLDRGYIIRDAQGKAIRMIGGMTDLTKIKRVQDELARSNEDLQQFAYVASHDLQEPLRAVSGCVQILKKRYAGQLDRRADELITHTVEGVERMQTLIHDLLTYSRVNTRCKAPQMTNLEEVVKTVHANLEVAIRDSSIAITHDSLPVILADSTQLTILFQNLIANAIKFRSHEPPRVHIAATRLSDAWQFAVTDNGIGMDPAYHERIFILFQRLHTRSEYPGTGIGLAMCKKVVERHGGRIWVESVPGQGSTFFFTIPDQQEFGDENG